MAPPRPIDRLLTVPRPPPAVLAAGRRPCRAPAVFAVSRSAMTSSDVNADRAPPKPSSDRQGASPDRFAARRSDSDCRPPQAVLRPPWPALGRRCHCLDVIARRSLAKGALFRLRRPTTVQVIRRPRDRLPGHLAVLRLLRLSARPLPACRRPRPRPFPGCFAVRRSLLPPTRRHRHAAPGKGVPRPSKPSPSRLTHPAHRLAVPRPPRPSPAVSAPASCRGPAVCARRRSPWPLSSRHRRAPAA